MDNREIIAIADPHLGTKKGDVDHILRFLHSLPPEKTKLLFLGDLFHIWAGPRKYHTEPVQRLMQGLEQFREKGGELFLVTGNRDAFFPGRPVSANESRLPFDLIAPDFLEITVKSKKLIAFHGDTINSKDKRYLRWRKLIRLRLFQGVFSIIPAGQVKKIMFSLEEKLKQTNMAFRKEFPEEEWLTFIQSIYEKHHPNLVLAGHFHPREPIVTQHQTTTGLIVPDWCENHVYLSIKDDLSYCITHFDD